MPRDAARHASSATSARHSVQQESASRSERSTALAFAATASDKFADEAESLSSLSIINYHDDAENARAHALLEETHDVAVDQLFETIGGNVKNKVGVARP